MKTKILVAVSLGLLLGVQLCQAATPGDYAVSIRPGATALIIGEPLFATGTFTNLTSEPVSLLGVAEAPDYARHGGQGTIQISTNGTAFSEVLAYEGGERVIIPPKVPARGSVREQFTLLADKHGRLLFPRAGEYWVRGRFEVWNHPEAYWVVSKAARVTVRDPTAEDAAVWKLLEADSRYSDLVRSPADVKLSEAESKRFDDILESHSHCTYAPYIALSLGRQAFEVQYGSRPIDLARAKTYLNKVLQLTSIETLRELASAGLENIHQLEQWESQKNRRPPKQPVTNLVYKAIAELEAQQYDVQGLLRGHYPTAKGSLRKFWLLSAEYDHSGMSGEECDRKRAEVLREVVEKYLTPLSPEEWQSRYAAYKEEDEARAKAEEESWRRLKEEGDEDLRVAPKNPGVRKK